MDRPETLFKPIRTERAFEHVSTKIKSLVFKGILKAGDKLPSETELARQFSVGRQTIREALRVLELSGFLTIQRGATGGAIITNTISDAISTSFIDAIQMKPITIDDLTVARLEIEKLVLSHVISNADDSDVERLQENILTAKRKIESNLQAFSENVQFHRLLASVSGNYVFVLVVESIMAVVADFLSRLEPDLEKSKQVVKSHEDILNAIIGRKSDEAIILLENHLLEIESWLQASDSELAQEQSKHIRS
jgi:DNA-binding FadR family transcriptional regulator